MNELEANIKDIQHFVNNCINKVYDSYSHSFSIKRELLTAEQTKIAVEKELEKVSDEFLSLLRQNPMLKSLSFHIESSDFLWESSFMEVLSIGEKKKYAAYNVLSLGINDYIQTPTRYDEELPYLSAVIEYGILTHYANYLKRLIPVEIVEEPIKEIEEDTTTEVVPVFELHDFESNFNDDQKALLVQCLNELKIFKTPITVEIMCDILSCTLKEPLRIARNKNKLLAYFFSALDNRSLITREWQAVCAKNKLFLSSGQGVVMQQGNFSSAVAQNNEFLPKDCHIIDNYIKQLKRD
jgi:hypothetical protein